MNEKIMRSERTMKYNAQEKKIFFFSFILQFPHHALLFFGQDTFEVTPILSIFYTLYPLSDFK